MTTVQWLQQPNLAYICQSNINTNTFYVRKCLCRYSFLIAVFCMSQVGVRRRKWSCCRWRGGDRQTSRWERCVTSLQSTTSASPLSTPTRTCRRSCLSRTVCECKESVVNCDQKYNGSDEKNLVINPMQILLLDILNAIYYYYYYVIYGIIIMFCINTIISIFLYIMKHYYFLFIYHYFHSLYYFLTLFLLLCFFRSW